MEDGRRVPGLCQVCLFLPVCSVTIPSLENARRSLPLLTANFLFLFSPYFLIFLCCRFWVLSLSLFSCLFVRRYRGI